MIEEFKAFFTLFQEGKELVNAKTWKNRQLLGNHLVALFGAAILVAHGFGYNIQIDADTLTAAAGGVGALLAVGNSVLTAITSAKVGVKGKK